MKRSIWIGHDPREQDAFDVCVASIKAHLSEDIPIHAISRHPLQAMGLYQRPIQHRDDRLWDVISDAPMATDFSLARFWLPEVCQDEVALFMDCDMLVRCDMAEVFNLMAPDRAIMVVQHDHRPSETVKMDGQVQTVYPRKNWSSVMLWNLTHPAHRLLTLHALNRWSGSALHQFKWLEDCEIGELPGRYNHLVGVDSPDPDARIVHFTLGIPSMAGYEDQEFADEWRKHLALVP